MSKKNFRDNSWKLIYEGKKRHFFIIGKYAMSNSKVPTNLLAKASGEKKKERKHCGEPASKAWYICFLLENDKSSPTLA